MAADEMTIAWSGNGTGDPVAGSAPLGVTRRSLAASDERVLIERAQGGDREAFEELVRIYDRDVLRIALNILHAPEDARDVYQESFLKIYKNLPRFRFECTFYTWTYRGHVTNVCLDHLQRRQQQPSRKIKPRNNTSNQNGDAPTTEFSLTASRTPNRLPIRSAVCKAWKSAAGFPPHLNGSRRASAWYLR